MTNSWSSSIRDSSGAVLAGLVVNYAAFYQGRAELVTERIAEWIMASTPSEWALPILEVLGAWAKPWAMTGALATLGFLLWIPALIARWTGDRWWLLLAPLGWFAVHGHVTYWAPAMATLAVLGSWQPVKVSGRREFLTQALMLSGTAGVAVESYVRNEALAQRAAPSMPLFDLRIPEEAAKFGAGLVRPPVTPVGQFYVMSKNAVDPVVDAGKWRLEITADGRRIADHGYRELMQLPREDRYQTLRCISNTLQTNLMSTAEWQGVPLERLLERRLVPDSAVECAVIGADGHGCSFPVEYAFSREFLLALGMNGRTLTRNHGYPVRLLAPRFYGFKHIKWIREIRFVNEPYLGTWPAKGFKKEAVIHTASLIDKIERRSATRLAVGGVSFAGVRGITRVEVRADRGEWQAMTVERPLSEYAWSRWHGEVETIRGAQMLEARACDGAGHWQESQERPQFPDGVAGPTFRRILI